MALVDQESLFTPFKPKKYQSGDPSKGLIQGYQSSTLTAPRTPSSYANPEAGVVNEAADGGLPAPATPSYSPPSNFDPDYQALLNYANTQGYTLPTAAQQFDQNNLIQVLKTNDTWAKLDLFYLFMTDGDEDFAGLNWKSPSTFKINPVNSPTFTSNIGYTGNGTDQYLETGWATTSGSNFTQNAASHGVYTNAIQAGVQYNDSVGLHGGGSNPSYNIINIYKNVGVYYLGNAVNGSIFNYSIPFKSRFWMTSRGFLGASTKQYITFGNDGLVSVDTTTTTQALTDDPIYIMQRGQAGSNWYAPSGIEFKADFWGGGMGQVNMQTLFKALKNYESTLS